MAQPLAFERSEKLDEPGKIFPIGSRRKCIEPMKEGKPLRDE
jgi:hypothetical protein